METTKPTADFELTRNAAGRLQLTTREGTVYNGVFPVRAFPIAAPDEGLSLLNQDSRELVWIERLTDLPDSTRAIIESELAIREFMPEILRIKHVSSYATPSTWALDTNKGETELVLKTEDHIRRLGRNSLIITDGHGINFLVRDTDQLDKQSKRILDRFL